MTPEEAHGVFGRIAIRGIDEPTTAFDQPMTSRGQAAAVGALVPLGACGAVLLTPATPGANLVGTALCLAVTPISVPAGAI